jgi:hypothetical protein
MEILQQLTVVAGVLLLLLGTLWWLKSRGYAASMLPGRMASRRMERLERLPLDPQHALHLIRWGEIDLLVASSPAGCSLVCQRPRSVEVLP